MSDLKKNCFFICNIILLLTCSSGNQSEIAGFYLNDIDEIGRWDSIMIEKLDQPLFCDVSLTHLSVDSFERMIIANNVQLIDVRTFNEFNAGHISRALCIDVNSDDFIEKAFGQLAIELPVAVYCKGGVRSRRAAEKLIYRGYRVYNLDKGFAEWEKSGKNISY